VKPIPRVTLKLSFRWVSGHAGLPGNKLETRLPKPEQHSPPAEVRCPLAPIIAKLLHTSYSTWRRNKSLSQFFLMPDFLGLLRRTSPSIPRSLWTVSILLPQSQASFILFLIKIKRKENNCSCLACNHQIQDLTHLLIHCTASKIIRRAITTSSIFDLLYRPWGVARQWSWLLHKHLIRSLKIEFLDFSTLLEQNRQKLE